MQVIIWLRNSIFHFLNFHQFWLLESTNLDTFSDKRLELKTDEDYDIKEKAILNLVKNYSKNQ